MTLYVRYLAWLHAVPKPDARTKRAQIGEAPTVSRLDRMKVGGIIPQMPPASALHIVNRLVEIGICESNGMGATPISWREINAWCERTHIDLPPWEARLIRKLSVEYLAEGRRAESENCPPPWRAEVTQREREVEEQRLRMVLG